MIEAARSDALLIVLQPLTSSQRVELLAQLLSNEIASLYASNFFSIEVKVQDGHVVNIRTSLSLKA